VSVSGGGWQPDDADLRSDRAQRSSGPTLQGQQVQLRTVTPDDYAFLRTMETSSELAPRWWFRGATPSPQEWTHGTWDGVLAQFLIVAKQDQARVGLVAAVNPSFQDGHARVTAAPFNPGSESPLMLHGLWLFIEYVFRCWNFRKLYLHLPEYGYPHLLDGYDQIVSMEGRFKEHYYLDGQLWDELILALYRDTWRELGGALVGGAQERTVP
jgi:hypothetical protein